MIYAYVCFVYMFMYNIYFDIRLYCLQHNISYFQLI